MAIITLPGQMQLPETQNLSFEDKPMRGIKQQKPCDIGLFSDSANQLDLIDMFMELEDE